MISSDMLRNPQIALMAAGLENFRQSQYSLSPGAVQASKSNGYAEGGFTGYPDRNGISGINEFMENLSAFKSNDGRQNEALLALATAVSDLKKWNPSLSIEDYERKKEQFQRTVNSGLKG